MHRANDAKKKMNNKTSGTCGIWPDADTPMVTRDGGARIRAELQGACTPGSTRATWTTQKLKRRPYLQAIRMMAVWMASTV